ncbi:MULTISPECIES: TIGR03364 family FAD-dependent oxidoreductase [Delftia]|uniref:TIGR03364 family FAD-dependent oxidoreductase n=1 Tax=Delftia lacustris TaxID=558537 RepID=A0A7T2YNE7_9BURK|nr:MULTISPECIES: TIGR03364 family FAD-dependent oxidoreductase [Delftia]EPD43916.1 FAD dependent oxidoreductase [Delftia acidovorans CCUG 15835]KAA9165667.1 TIGR03364 family FAD-dependent oxidoreductase [Delftia sp. BR1]QPS78939.1 TIGR03364 family FAD-dependent oxidoreductase [Delftia lacustris]
MKNYDLIVVGAGIVGLAHAYAAARRGRSVLVIERDAACISASIRNFGFVTVTGQQAGAHWQRAMRSRDTWAEIAPQAGIEVVHRGLWLTARRASAEAVLHAFLSTSMGERCELLTPAQAAERHPALRTEDLSAVLYSPHELRVESRTAIARLAQWLEQAMGVDFRFGEAVLDVAAPRVRSTRASYHGERVVVCNNADPGGLFAGLWTPHRIQLCQLQMLRVRPQPGLQLKGSVMGDLSMVRYEGYSALPEAAALRAELEREEGESLAHGIHLIAVQSADGSLVVGDSHHYGAAPQPFASEAVDRLMLRHMNEALHLRDAQVVERWVGVYPSAQDAPCVVHAPDEATRVVAVTGGSGASTAFGLAEEVWSAW